MWKQSSKMSSKEKLLSAQQAYDCALNLLSYHDYSEQRLLERLRHKGATDEGAREAAGKLKHYGLLDEQRYAARVYEGWLSKRGYGRLHLQAELQKRGVRQEYINEILEQFDNCMEEQHAENAARLFMQRNSKKLAAGAGYDKKIYAAAARFMAARGFSSRYMHVLLNKLQANDNM